MEVRVHGIQKQVVWDVHYFLQPAAKLLMMVRKLFVPERRNDAFRRIKVDLFC